MRVPMPVMPVMRSSYCSAPLGLSSVAASASCDSLSGLARQICYTSAS